MTHHDGRRGHHVRTDNLPGHERNSSARGESVSRDRPTRRDAGRGRAERHVASRWIATCAIARHLSRSVDARRAHRGMGPVCVCRWRSSRTADRRAAHGRSDRDPGPRWWRVRCPVRTSKRPTSGSAGPNGRPRACRSKRQLGHRLTIAARANTAPLEHRSSRHSHRADWPPCDTDPSPPPFATVPTRRGPSSDRHDSPPSQSGDAAFAVMNPDCDRSGRSQPV